MRSLSTQTLAVVFAVMLVSHLIGITIYALDRRDAITSTEAHDIAERIVSTIQLIEGAPEKRRTEIAQLTSSRNFRVALSNRQPTVDLEPADDLSEEIAAFMSRELPGPRSGRIVVGFVRQVAVTKPPTKSASLVNRLSNARRSANLHVAVPLPDGHWLSFIGSVDVKEPVWPGTAGVYVIVMALGMGVAAVWLVRRVTAPLARFALAADRLGKDISAEPLRESGPIEVVQASRAFNDMQRRLKRLVEHRTEMLAAISHDLRTPVTLLRLRAEQVDDVENRGRLLQTLDDMESMIASTLAFARETSNDEPSRRLDLSALVASICDDLADAGTRCEFDAPEHLLVNGRPVALKRALTNVIENAAKYGLIAKVKLTDHANASEIVVDDEGPGVAPNELERIFLPFYRVDHSRSRDKGGVGLGLSIAQSIIHDHGGTIMAKNGQSGGLSVKISLPK